MVITKKSTSLTGKIAILVCHQKPKVKIHLQYEQSLQLRLRRLYPMNIASVRLTAITPAHSAHIHFTLYAGGYAIYQLSKTPTTTITVTTSLTDSRPWIVFSNEKRGKRCEPMYEKTALHHLEGALKQNS
ncbi:hypothetical protein Zmor_016438 [Zophobas morio]|jgi:hypothetical protein|uniref:Uncharacterized protein n=1 Tax=Zophobas morio TaxID=2755281 RepID=A0AA38HJW9_9CUCU|nr:hypothetical protein Zmor_016438 [Zophobas morio]